MSKWSSNAVPFALEFRGMRVSTRNVLRRILSIDWRIGYRFCRIGQALTRIGCGERRDWIFSGKRFGRTPYPAAEAME
jgi:hypothetical protein